MKFAANAPQRTHRAYIPGGGGGGGPGGGGGILTPGGGEEGAGVVIGCILSDRCHVFMRKLPVIGTRWPLVYMHWM